ncbi:MAG: tRNA pseudouridine(55) synthase TruB [Oscillospiraceae bacterium]|nr:tRNA pseudouridine(55) synthase TruB [Oscillospiraceae bacterium]MBQ7053932.1 tRNA pseudouridine(55) synthase TruB [Oscillospiraceae bacterium]
MNGIVIIDKPAGITSHGVVSRMRKIFGTRRVGHSGTLDPMATGVLPVFVGRATRACEFALCDEKAYIARFRLGVVTDTQDITGTVIEERPVSVAQEQVFDVCRSFCGEILQTPPMYSALKVDGVALYKLAREGKTVEREARKITIHSINPSYAGNDEYEIEVSCSKGTYIRTLIYDIGEKLGCGASMTALRRTKSGIFTIDRAKTIEETEAEPTLLPVDFMFSEYSPVTIDAKGEKKCRNGAPVPGNAEDGVTYRVYSENGEFLMLARGDKSGALVTVKSFFEVQG